MACAALGIATWLAICAASFVYLVWSETRRRAKLTYEQRAAEDEAFARESSIW